jgi:hypothetical protein
MLMEQLLQNTCCTSEQVAIVRQRSSTTHPHYIPCYPLTAQNLQLSHTPQVRHHNPQTAAQRATFLSPLSLDVCDNFMSIKVCALRWPRVAWWWCDPRHLPLTSASFRLTDLSPWMRWSGTDPILERRLCRCRCVPSSTTVDFVILSPFARAMSLAEQQWLRIDMQVYRPTVVTRSGRRCPRVVALAGKKSNGPRTRCVVIPFFGWPSSRPLSFDNAPATVHACANFLPSRLLRIVAGLAQQASHPPYMRGEEKAPAPVDSR